MQPVTVSDELIARARRLERQALESILTHCYPPVHRMAHGLAGSTVGGQKITRLVLRQGLRVMPTWRAGTIAENWFYHHTLLAARELAPVAPPPDRDLLLISGPAQDPGYAAFVRALRSLPRQQMEAFVLNQGEKLNARLLGVAMDSSTQAAATHLSAAAETLRGLAGNEFENLSTALSRAYAALSPPETLVRGIAHRQASQALWAKRLRRLIRRILLLIVLGAIAWAAWRWRDLLIHWYGTVRSAVTTRPV